MAFDGIQAKENMRRALDLEQHSKSLPIGGLPIRKEKRLVQTSFSIEAENKEKLIRLAQKNGYGKSTSAFLNDWIASVKE